MTPTKLLIGQILLVFTIVIAGVWTATQWVAAMLGYQPQLGPAWFAIANVPVYRPWQIFAWWYHYDAYAPHVFAKAGALAGASGFIGCAAAIMGSLWRARQQRHVTTYGSARWAGVGEIERAGLIGDAGVFLGQQRGNYLRHDGPEHVMAFAPTRSGMGATLNTRGLRPVRGKVTTGGGGPCAPCALARARLTAAARRDSVRGSAAPSRPPRVDSPGALASRRSAARLTNRIRRWGPVTTITARPL